MKTIEDIDAPGYTGFLKGLRHVRSNANPNDVDMIAYLTLPSPTRHGAWSRPKPGPEELHLHLEGAMRLEPQTRRTRQRRGVAWWSRRSGAETLTELCRKHGVKRPMDTCRASANRSVTGRTGALLHLTCRSA